MKSALKTFCDTNYDLNKQMHDTLAEFIKEHGGLIRTENPKNDKIYAIVYDEREETYRDMRVLAATTFEEGKNVAILVDEDGYTTIEGVTDEELLDADAWHTIYGGMVMYTATLYNLCECIEEYVK